MHDRYLRRLKRPINWDKVKALPSRMLISYSDLETCPNDAMLEHDLLQKLAIVKLNGGRGASMECSGPKSAVQVREDTTFLDMTVHQVEYMNTRYGTDVPLVLMNSFYTHEETIKIVRKYVDCVRHSQRPALTRGHPGTPGITCRFTASNSQSCPVSIHTRTRCCRRSRSLVPTWRRITAGTHQVPATCSGRCTRAGFWTSCSAKGRNTCSFQTLTTLARQWT